MALIAQLVSVFSGPRPNGILVKANRKSIALTGRPSSSLTVMRQEIAHLLGGATSEQLIQATGPRSLADTIVSALSAALAAEGGRRGGEDAEAVLRDYMQIDAVDRIYKVRTFLGFLGMVILTAILYSLILPKSWLNPPTALFMLLAYLVLIVTSVVHERTRVKRHE